MEMFPVNALWSMTRMGRHLPMRPKLWLFRMGLMILVTSGSCNPMFKVPVT